ncbi:MarR family winged helix-turn-helix transcriptional regulator [Photobacterium kagoshimensis]|uniref:MarR family winged helix-turn-helix transcriptional regulator n=1 Tax=Photobacterium kagoshimensis TaxID=2910242 RepID=UPI003D0BAD6F
MLTNELEKQFTRNGCELTREQWIFLMTLMNESPLTPLVLANRLMKNRGSITSLIKGLEKRQLIQKVTINNDGRSYGVQITALGIQLAEQTKHIAFDVLGQALAGFDETEQQQMHSLMLRFVQNLTGENS